MRGRISLQRDLAAQFIVTSQEDFAEAAVSVRLDDTIAAGCRSIVSGRRRRSVRDALDERGQVGRGPRRGGAAGLFRRRHVGTRRHGRSLGGGSAPILPRFPSPATARRRLP